MPHSSFCMTNFRGCPKHLQVTTKACSEMWKFSLEMFVVQEEGDCWFELPRITLCWFFVAGSTAHARVRLVPLLYYSYIFNLFFPLGVHLYLSGWHLISFYCIVLPHFGSKVSAYVILTFFSQQ